MFPSINSQKIFRKIMKNKWHISRELTAEHSVKHSPTMREITKHPSITGLVQEIMGELSELLLKYTTHIIFKIPAAPQSWNCPTSPVILAPPVAQNASPNCRFQLSLPASRFKRTFCRQFPSIWHPKRTATAAKPTLTPTSTLRNCRNRVANFSSFRPVSWHLDLFSAKSLSFWSKGACNWRESTLRKIS